MVDWMFRENLRTKNQVLYVMFFNNLDELVGLYRWRKTAQIAEKLMNLYILKERVRIVVVYGLTHYDYTVHSCHKIKMFFAHCFLSSEVSFSRNLNPAFGKTIKQLFFQIQF